MRKNLLFTKIKFALKKIPIINLIYGKYFNHNIITFTDSINYWKKRYALGGNSGYGSYGILAEFKAEIINKFVKEKKVKTIIEYGCGDGNQLKLAEYPSYIGFDVSPKAIDDCKIMFSRDTSKTFMLMDEYRGEKAQLVLSLDVIFHLIEEDIFVEYMNRLFESAEKYIIIYSSNTSNNEKFLAKHVKHRKFTEWVEKNKKEWKLDRIIPNRYPFTGDNKTGSFCDFYIYLKI